MHWSSGQIPSVGMINNNSSNPVWLTQNNNNHSYFCQVMSYLYHLLLHYLFLYEIFSHFADLRQWKGWQFIWKRDTLGKSG